MCIHGWLYTHNSKPCQVLVPTWCLRLPGEVGPRFRYVESILDNASIQPYVHDVIVNIEEGEWTYTFEFSMNCTMHFPNVHSSGSEEACLSCGSLPLSLSQWWTCGIMIIFFLISWLRSKLIFVLYLWHNAHLYVQVCFKTQKYKQEAVTRVSDIPEAC